MSELDALPATNLDAERAVVSLMCQSREAVGQARASIGVVDFYDRRNALVFAACVDMFEREDTIEPLTVINELRRSGELEAAGGANYLHSLYALPVTGGAGAHYLKLVHVAAQMRHLLAIGQRITQIATDIRQDPERALDLVAAESLELQLLIDEPDRNAPILGLSTWESFCAKADDPQDWIVPELFERQDVFLLLGSEGGGKSWLTRQICMAIAGGVHPFRPERHIPVRTTLLVDLENAESMVRRQSRPMGSSIAALGQWPGTHGYIWHMPGGLDLRRRADALLLERVVAEVRPDLIALGSLYKAYRRGRDDWDTAASEAIAVLDHIRGRYRCAFLLEHHMPKGDGHTRPQTPFGSSEWMRWASHGRIISRVGPNAYRLGSEFRGDRDVRDIPVGLSRGGQLPWTAIWDPDELEYLSEKTPSTPAHPRRTR